MAHPTEIGRGWALMVLLAYPFVLPRRPSRNRMVLIGCSLLYLAAVLAVTIFPIVVAPPAWRVDEHWWQVVRLIPFVVPPVGFVLNIVMFVPFGVLLPLLWPATGSRRRIAAWGFAASAAIELTQLGMWVALGNRRMFDVNDLMSNTAGAVLGLLLLRAVMPAPDNMPAAAPIISKRR